MNKQNSGKKCKKYKTEEAENIFRKMLKEAGFQYKEPNVKLAWGVFKEMCLVEFECAGDDLLFETGTYNFEGQEEFLLSFVRQFTIEVDGEYDYMEQLHLDFGYKPEAELGSLKKILWTYDFDGDFSKFFQAVEQSPAFLIPQEKFVPEECELFIDEV